MDRINKVDAMRFILNEVQNLKINHQELWDFMRLSKKYTGLPYSILVDNGEAYSQHGHDLWLYVEYDGKLFPVTISETPIVKVLANVKGLDFEPVFSFIRNNQRLLKNLADGKTMTDVFLSLVKRYDSLLESANSHRLLTEMSKLYRHESGLPTDIWVDENETYQPHAPRIKFRPSPQVKNSYDYPSMEIVEPFEIFNLNKKDCTLTNKQINQIKGFVKANQENLLKVANKEMEFADFKTAIVSVDEEGNPLPIGKPVVGKLVNGWAIVTYNGKYNYTDEYGDMIFDDFVLDDASNFVPYGNGILLASVERDGKCFLIDTNGKEINVDNI
ncbi:MAG: hypothetical protein J6X18_13380 [Bacteroidales bacterium]|nr:hypothetical protein [Bacteroidales bacterium]